MNFTNSEWNWLLSFPGILSIVSVTIIVIVGTALYREWRHDRIEGSDLALREHKKPT